MVSGSVARSVSPRRSWIARSICSCIGLTSGKPRKARASSGVQSIFMVIFIVPCCTLLLAIGKRLDTVERNLGGLPAGGKGDRALDRRDAARHDVTGQREQAENGVLVGGIGSAKLIGHRLTHGGAPPMWAGENAPRPTGAPP